MMLSPPVVSLLVELLLFSSWSTDGRSCVEASPRVFGSRRATLLTYTLVAEYHAWTITTIVLSGTSARALGTKQRVVSDSTTLRKYFSVHVSNVRI